MAPKIVGQPKTVAPIIPLSWSVLTTSCAIKLLCIEKTIFEKLRSSNLSDTTLLSMTLQTLFRKSITSGAINI
jgi:hypothetical protein